MTGNWRDADRTIREKTARCRTWSIVIHVDAEQRQRLAEEMPGRSVSKLMMITKFSCECRNIQLMMTSSNGNIFGVTGHLCGNSPHKGQWRGALVFSLICAWINGWVNNREAGDLRCHRGHYDVNVMCYNMTMKTQSERWGLAKIYILASMFVRSVRKSTGICTNPSCICVSNFMKICQSVRYITSRQTNRQTNILAKLQILATNKVDRFPGTWYQG